MSQNGVTQQYKALTDQYQSIPFREKPKLGHQQVRRWQGSRRIVFMISRSGTTNPQRSRSSNHVTSERGIGKSLKR